MIDKNSVPKEVLTIGGVALETVKKDVVDYTFDDVLSNLEGLAFKVLSTNVTHVEYDTVSDFLLIATTLKTMDRPLERLAVYVDVFKKDMRELQSRPVVQVADSVLASFLRKSVA